MPSFRRLTGLVTPSRSPSPSYYYSDDSDDEESCDSSKLPLFRFHTRPAIHLPITLNLTRRRKRRPGHVLLVFACLVSTAVLVVYTMLLTTTTAKMGVGLYEDIWEFEDGLPQHHADVTREVEKKRYLWFDGMLTGHGLNNVLQESLLLSYLAYASDRSFVFQDFIWSTNGLPYVVDPDALSVRPSRIPLNAFISGPTAGGGPSNSSHPLAVSAKFFHSACPLERRTVISSDDAPTDQDGTVLLEWWKELLGRYEDVECLVVDSTRKTVFDWDLLASPRALPLYAALRSSPILQQFSWSPLVQSAVLRNFAALKSADVQVLSGMDGSKTLPGLVAVHLRRGDYQRHCPRLARAHAAYTGMNQEPELLDHFAPTPASASEEEELQRYLPHCLPTIPQVVSRLREVRKDNPSLRKVFLLSNASPAWLLELEQRLREDGWGDVRGTGDMVLDRAQGYVGMAVDMAAAERAEVFLGNGFSSMTANIIMLRMSKGLPTSANRLL